MEVYMDIHSIVIRDLADLYIKVHNLSVINLNKDGKSPIEHWRVYQNSMMSDEEISQTQWENLGIVTGTISNLVVLDAQTVEAVSFLYDYSMLKSKTKVITEQGKHFYVFINNLPVDFCSFRICKKSENIVIDVKANGDYVVAPVSEVNNHFYSWEYPKLSKAILTRLEFEDFVKFLIQLHADLALDVPLHLYEFLKEPNDLAQIPIKHQAVSNDLNAITGDIKQSVIEDKNSISNVKVKDYDELLEVELTDEDLSNLVNLTQTKNEISKVYETSKASKVSEAKYLSKDGFIHEITKNKTGNTLIMLGPDIKIQALIKDGNCISYEFSFHDVRQINETDTGAEVRGYLEEIEDFEKIRKLTGYSILNKIKYSEWLNHEVKKCDVIKYVRKQTGWDKGIFYHPALQIDDIWKVPILNRLSAFTNDITKQWHFVKNALYEGSGLAMLYAFSLASVLNTPLQTAPSVCFVTGIAQSGKTTACTLATNLFYPADKVSLSTHSTTVGFELILKSLKDIAVFFDECMLKDIDLEKIVFMVSSKVGKVRGNKNLTVNISDIASNVFFTSEISESTLFKRTGSQRRLLNLTITDFSKDVLNSLPLSEVHTLRDCYGLGADIAKFIQDNIDKVKSLADDIKKVIDDNQLNSIYNIAVPMLTAIKVFESFYSAKFNHSYDFILSMLCKQNEEFTKRIDVANKFIEDFSQFLLRKNNQFLDTSEPTKRTFNENIGLRDGKDIFILTKVFAEFCGEYGFDKTSLISELINKKILKPSAHNAIRVMKKIAGISVSTYHITLPDYNIDEHAD